MQGQLSSDRVDNADSHKPFLPISSPSSSPTNSVSLLPSSPEYSPGFPLLCSARPCCGEEEKAGGHTQDFSPSLCLTARERKRSENPSRCSRTATMMKNLPWSDALAWEGEIIYRGSEVLQGSIPRSGTRLRGGDEYLRNGASKPLKEGGGFPCLSTT